MIRPDDPDYLAQLDVWLDDLTRARARRRRLWAAWTRTLVEVAAAVTFAVVLLWMWGAR